MVRVSIPTIHLRNIYPSPWVFFLTRPREKKDWKKNNHHLSSEKNTWLFDVYWDYTTQLYRDYNKPSKRSLGTNQNGMSAKGFFSGCSGAWIYWETSGFSGSARNQRFQYQSLPLGRWVGKTNSSQISTWNSKQPVFFMVFSIGWFQIIT